MKLEINKDLAFRRIAGELYIVDAAGSRLHELNGTAALVWEGLAAGKTEEAIVSAIAGEYEIDKDSARADLKEFVKELLAAGLVLERK